MPDTVNPPLAPTTVPAVVVPSPQLIVAVKSLATAVVLVSVNVATAPLNGWFGLASKIMPVPVS